jgi:hypothetical protein
MEANALSVLVPIRPHRVKPLETLLLAIGGDIQGNPHIPFDRLETTHFCRWVVVPGETGRYPNWLAFESNHDGSLDDYLVHLFQTAGPGLHEIYSHCEGWPSGGFTDVADFRRFFRRHMIPYAAFHMAYRGLRLQDVRDNTRIRQIIEAYLDGQTPGARPVAIEPHELQRRLAAEVRRLLAGTLDIKPVPVNKKSSLPMIVWLVAAILLTIAAWPVLLLWVLILRRREQTDRVNPPRPVQADPVVAGKENQDSVQNQLTHLVEIKPGWFRLLTLKAVLAAINLLARLTFNQGSLGTITTIHFARWVFIDNNRRLLFFSNYDGSWESYLGDFIDKASLGLTGIWGNTVDFPRTRFLVFDGATNEESFKEWTRGHQILTHVWYSAHPTETVRNILANAQLRNGLESNLDDAALRDWLRLL